MGVPPVIGCDEDADVVLDPDGALLGMTGVFSRGT